MILFLGVESAFCVTPKVMTVSFHKYSPGFFPGQVYLNSFHLLINTFNKGNQPSILCWKKLMNITNYQLGLLATGTLDIQNGRLIPLHLQFSDIVINLAQ
jgi:hypothetical protein